MARQSRPFEVKYHLRIIALIILVVVVFVLASMRAFQFQIVEGESHLQTAQKNSDTTITVIAARGEIVDRKGVPFTHNKAVFNIEFDYSFLKAGTENDIIFNLIHLLQKQNEKWIDQLPITEQQPYEFIPDSETDVTRLKKKIGVNEYATANDCMENMYRDFKIKKHETSKGKCTHCGQEFDKCEFEGYEEQFARKILGVRYEMLQADFSVRNRYTFAEDVSPQTVALIREFSDEHRGVYVVERAKRTYVGGEVASHIIGTIGPIYEEDIDKYINPDGSDYFRTDLIGKSGIEKAAEADLKGKNGKLRITLDAEGNIIDTIEEVAPIAGKTVQLTLDFAFQKELQQILADYIKEFNETNKEKKFSEGASIVVLDAKTGGVLASVSYPYYDINDYTTNYTEVLNRPGKPLNNKALQGLYRPGSTYKPIVAAAGLDKGLITAQTEVFCTYRYTRWDDYQPTCLSIGHGRQNLDVAHALEYSCNIFFYDLGWNLGITNQNKYAEYFGLGVDTGLEIPNSKGVLSSKQYSESRGATWVDGGVIQAAIGQQDTGVTPLQMAIEAMTIANKGTRFNAHLIDGWLTNDGAEVISKKETTIASQYDMSDDAFNAITHGMILAANTVGSPYQLTDLGYQVAIKTGSPEYQKGKANNAFIAFAPVNEPEIAISCMVEDGYNTAQLVRRILEAYERTK